MYETFEHTADLGLRIRAPSLSELFEEAARALFSVLVANPDVIRPLAEIPLEIEGTQREDLLHDWLAELLYQFDGRHLLLTDFEVTLTQVDQQQSRNPCFCGVDGGIFPLHWRFNFELPG